MKNLKEVITALIYNKKEGQYWDFKKIPHENKADLLHDILCLANTKHNGDRYLIFGVSDPSEGTEVIGLKSDNIFNRKNQQQFIDFLRSKEFAGTIRPDIGLETIHLNQKEIDILVISNQPLKPYYITKKYFDGNRQVLPNHIYTRINDTNTPIDKSADLLNIENMWRERFHLDVPPKEKMLLLMASPSEWYKDLGNSIYSYHNIYPEYRIEFQVLEKFETKEAYCYFYPNPTSYLGRSIFYYHNTQLFELEYMTCDEMRIYLPVPEVCFISNGAEEEWFFYYIKEDISGIFLNFLTDGRNSFSSGRIGEAPFLLFPNNAEYEKFKSLASDNIKYIKGISPDLLAIQANREKEMNNDQLVISPIFLDQIRQYFLRVH